jgi:hypothetical protein
MTPLVPIVMFGWLPFVLSLFAFMPARRAVIVGYVGAWLFLPIATYPITGLPDYDKTTATTFAVILGVMLFDAGRLAMLRPRWWDAPIVIWCLTPFVSDVTSGYGVYEGFSSVIHMMIGWGIPYVIGRLYFSDWDGVKDLLVGLAAGGLIYIPLVLIEVRLSPQLHIWVYGYHQHSFDQTRRMGGWRPTVFMQHGLAVALFMSTAALAAFGLWLWGSARAVFGIPLSYVWPALFVVAMLCKSAYAMALLLIGMALLWAAKAVPAGRLVLVLFIVPVLYMSLRTVGGWDGQLLLDVSTAIAGADRAFSLEVRLNSESALWRLTRERPLFGYGRWEWGQHAPDGSRMIPDGLWIIALGRNGLIGLSAMTLTFILPPMALLMRVDRRHYRSPFFGPWAVITVALALYVLDNLLNAMLNPLYLLGAGGLAGAASVVARRTAVRPLPAAGPGRVPIRGEPSP